MTLRRQVTIAATALLGACALVWHASSPADAKGTEPEPAPVTVRAAEMAAKPKPRVPIHGTDFPDGVIALTWDDGPDVHTLELARFLHDQHVSGTFFAVGAWVPGLSEEPGFGKKKLETGYEVLPVLDEVVALGQRVGNHTLNHVLLGHATPETLREQFVPLPITHDRVHMFRAPAGWWTNESATALDDSDFADFVGPIHWDIDAKDWECSLYCRSDDPAHECETGPKPNEPRVKASVIAQRYLAKIESARHGIVLMHDRVGDVGSRYALDIAQRLVPALVARGYVFSGPILRFAAAPTPAAVPDAVVHEGDLNGDGRADECWSSDDGVVCRLAGASDWKDSTVWSTEPLKEFTLADANGDGRADLCSGTRCWLAP